MIDLSVLVASVHTRYATFGLKIQHQLWKQLAALSEADQARVEIIMLTDNKQMMLGQKRNVMVDMAQGRYVVFVDDDDRLEPYYLEALLDATEENSDVITFMASVSLNGEEPKLCTYSIRYMNDHNTELGYERLPNHICAVKRDIARQVSFPNIVYGEDSSYSKLLKPLLLTETFIEDVLYHYDYNSTTTETQQHLNATLRVRPDVKPIVDVVMLSRAPTKELWGMTQRAIDSCIAGANSLPVNVIVLEQEAVEYRNAKTIHMPEEFNYNAFANRGAELGFAEWIMVANNDLVFSDGWLHHLLAADHPVVSPRCPRDLRQAHVTTNTIGSNTAEHFSGWCFMIKRSLWHDIGGFDEDVAFWCSDDAVIQQVLAQATPPMLVPDSVVQHLGSVTLKQVENYEDLTWRQLDAFINKYGSHRLEKHEEYLRWKAHNGVKSPVN